MRSGFFSTVTKDRSLLWGLVVTLLFVFGQWSIMGLFYWQLPPEIPLWYSLPPGRQQLAVSEWFWLLPIMGLLLFVINVVILRLSLGLLPVFRQIVVWLGALVEMLLTIAMIHIIMLAL